MRLTVGDVLAQLRSEGLGTPAADPLARAALARSQADDAPWYLRAAVGFGAWIATAFLLGFLFTLVEPEDLSSIVVGLVLLPLAVWLRREAAGEFLRHGAVALALAGQGLVMAGVGEMTDSGTWVGAVGGLLSVALIWLMPDRIHRFLATVVGSISALVAVGAFRESVAYEVVTLALVALTGYVWRVGLGHRSDAAAEMLEPVGYGVIVALFLALSFSGATSAALIGELGESERIPHLGPLTTIGITAALGALGLAILDEHGVPRQSGLTFGTLAGVAALGLGALYSPGVVAGAAVLALAFDRRNRVLMGLGIVGLFVFGSMYYYSLALTLLEKSGVLIGTGLLFLAVRSRLPRAPDPETTR